MVNGSSIFHDQSSPNLLRSRILDGYMPTTVTPTMQREGLKVLALITSHLQVMLPLQWRYKKKNRTRKYIYICYTEYIKGNHIFHVPNVFHSQLFVFREGNLSP